MIESDLDRLDLDLIDWLLHQMLVEKVKSPIFTAQVLVNLYTKNPKLIVPPVPLSDQERDSRRLKVIRFVNSAYDDFLKRVIDQENRPSNTSDIFGKP